MNVPPCAPPQISFVNKLSSREFFLFLYDCDLPWTVIGFPWTPVRMFGSSAIGPLPRIETIQTQTVDDLESDASVSTAMQGLRETVKAIQGQCQLPPSSELVDLLEMAVQANGMPEDVLQWTRKLAEDVSSLTD